MNIRELIQELEAIKAKCGGELPTIIETKDDPSGSAIDFIVCGLNEVRLVPAGEVFSSRFGDHER